MSQEKPERQEQPLHEWLPTVILKFLVFAAFAFVLYEATVGLGEYDLGSGRVGVIIAGMAGLLLLLAVDRLETLKFSATGVEATLAEAQVHAMADLDTLEDRDAAQAARAQVLRAENPEQVQAAMAVAVELNVSRVVERVKEAIREKRKCYVRYKRDPEKPVEKYLVAPLDIKPGETPTTQANDYLWVHSYETKGTRRLRLDRVMKVDATEETFDPAELMAGWKKEPEWNVARDW
jgi:hypothetical protein